MTFDSFIENIYKQTIEIPNNGVYRHIKLIQYDFIYDEEGNCLVTEVLRFENYKGELKKFIEKYDINININFSEKHNTTDHDDYRKYYTNQKTIDYVQIIYKKDFEVFGYSKEI